MEIQYKKRIVFGVIVIGFVFGVFYSNLELKEYAMRTNLYQAFFKSDELYVMLQKKAYFFHVIRSRITMVLFLAISGNIKFKRTIAGCILLLTGFIGGVFMTLTVMAMGLTGIVFCFVSLLPHGIFYAVAYMIYMFYLFLYPQIPWTKEKTYLILLGCAIGLLTECYINPGLVQLFFVR